MNSVLVSIAVGVVLALFSALVAPFFIDWNAYRGVVETRLSNAFGFEVVINGPLDVRILPFPALDIQNLEFHQAGSQYPLVIVPELNANLALTPILRGRVEVTDIELRQPIVTVPLGAGGLPQFPALALTGLEREAVEISQIDISDGTFVLVDAQGRPTNTLTGITLSGQAVSLEGPFKVEGKAENETESFTYKISTGRLREDGAIRAKIDVDPTTSPRSYFLDAFIGSAEGSLALDGSFRIVQEFAVDKAANPTVRLEDIPWELSGNIQGPLKNLTLQELKFHAGPEDRRITLEGVARVQLQPVPRVEALLSSRQIDFDRVLRTPGEGEAWSSPGQALELLGEVANLLSQTGLPVELSLGTEVAILGGNLVENVALDVFSRDGLVEVRRAEALLPGKSNFAFTGNVDPANASVIGNLRLETRHAAALAKWLNLDPAEFGPLFSPGERVNLVLATRLDVNPNALQLQDFKVLADDTEIFGSLVFPMNEVNSANPGKLAVDLTLNRLDVDKFVSFEGVDKGLPELMNMVADALPGRDMSVRLQAKKLSISGLTANGLSIDADFSGAALNFRKFKLEDLAGTTIEISGQLDGLSEEARGNIKANIKSSDLTGFAEFITRLGLRFEDGSSWVSPKQAKALSPADLTVSLQANPEDAGTIALATLSGVLSGTDLAMEMNYKGAIAAFLDGKLDGSFNFNNADSLALLSQLGVDVEAQKFVALYRKDLDVASAQIVFEGSLNEPLAVNAEFQLLNSSATFNGSAWPGQDAAVSGEFKITSDDANSLLTVIGTFAEQEDAIAGQLQSKVLADLEHVELNELSGQVGGNEVAGRLNVNFSRDPVHIGGRLQLDALALSWMSNLISGQESWSTEHGWSETPFEMEAPHGFSGALEFAVERLVVTPNIHLKAVSFLFGLDAEQAKIESFKGELVGGVLTGQANIEFSHGSAALQTGFHLNDGQLEEIFVRQDETTSAAGRFTINGEMSGAGRSWLGIVSSLAGGGAFNLEPGILHNLSPDAFTNIVEAADEELDLADTIVKDQFAKFLETGPFEFLGTAGEFTITGGQISSKSVTLDSGDVQIRMASEMDIAQRELNSTWSLSARQATAINEITPAVTIRFFGPWDKPERVLDTTDLTNYLTVRRIERDVRNLENAQAAAREREEALAAQEQAAREAAVAESEKKENEVPNASQTQSAIPQQSSDPAPQPTPQVGAETPKPAPVTTQQPAQTGQSNGGDQDSLQRIIENALRESDVNSGLTGSNSETVLPAPPIDLGPPNQAPAFQNSGGQAPALPPAIELGERSPSTGVDQGPTSLGAFPEQPVQSQSNRRSLRVWDPNASPEGLNSGR